MRYMLKENNTYIILYMCVYRPLIDRLVMITVLFSDWKWYFIRINQQFKFCIMPVEYTADFFAFRRQETSLSPVMGRFFSLPSPPPPPS